MECMWTMMLAPLIHHFLLALAQIMLVYFPDMHGSYNCCRQMWLLLPLLGGEVLIKILVTLF